MKLREYKIPESSFLHLEKDMSLISELFLKNERLKKLLHYTTPDALNKPSIGEENSYALFGKNIKMVPKLYIDKEVLNYVVINFDNFTPNATNSEFRNNLIIFDIICHNSQWNLADFKLRPYKIAGEIDAMLDKKRFTGIGQTLFLGANQFILNDEFSGLSLQYGVIHGDEDKKKMLNPAEEEVFIEEFNEMYN